MLDAHIVKVRAQFTIDVALEIAASQTCGLFGVSGSGKSTILACIAGAEQPDGGHVVLDRLELFPPPLPLHRRPIGYLTQDASLFPHLRVAENVRFGVGRGTRDGSEDWVAELRERLELGPIWHAYPQAISGGQARRVGLARMLARRPRLVLLDEPFGGLDRGLVRELIGALSEWQRRLGFALLVVDHQADVLARLCGRALALERGRIVQDATWSELRANPATPSLAGLLAPL